MKNRRKHIRHPVKKVTEFVVKDRCYCGTVLNLTEKGSFIQAKGPFSIGDTITIAYQLDSVPIREVRRPGTIKRVTEEGIGIEFKKPVT